MNTTERPNRDALNKALDVYRDAMRPFLIRSLKRVQGKSIEDTIYDSLPPRQAGEFDERLETGDADVEALIDIGHFSYLVSRNWRREVFGMQFTADMTVQDRLRLIGMARNHAAHPDRDDLDSEYTRTCLFHIAEVLDKINAPEEKRAVEEIRDALFATELPAEPLPQTREESKVAPAPDTGGLKPWREVIPPNLELTQGTFEEAELAADLQQVYDGSASATSYGNPVSFFNQTYLTGGIRTLLVNALKRLGGNDGHRIIQMKTGFGGGKTHSLIALYHLVNSVEALANMPADSESAQTRAEIHSILQEAEWDGSIQPRVAVLSGTWLSPTDANVTEDGAPLNTLWGVMAYQLGGQDAYDIIGKAARRQDTSPGGEQLDKLFQHVGPCVILIDELVAYMLNTGENLEVNYTFVQILSEAVRRADNVVLVVTLPQSEREAGGVKGAEVLATLETRMGRVESIWKPLETNEAFEVVRRRLFGNEIDTVERDRTCNAFLAVYNRAKREFPPGVHEQRYLERMKACYPIHPEIFDRLHSDWSTIHEFQRTRGVLRLLASCISRLYRMDTSPLIMPGNLPLNDPNLSAEFEKLLPGRWEAVLSEVDSDGSRVDVIDETQRFAVLGGAARRIARTVFLGSCPSGAIRGIDANRIHLGVVQPGQRVSTYTEALREMTGVLYYLYIDDNRYFFHAEENLNKVAIDRAAELSTEELNEHIVAELGEAVGRRRAGVVVCPEDLGAIPDSDALCLVILPPDKLLPSRATEGDDATSIALRILKQCANAERTHRNTLLFLTAKTDDIRTLRIHSRDYLAWASILSGERRVQNLVGERLRQAQASLRTAEELIRRTIPKTYRWAIAPAQLDPQVTEFQMFPEQTHLLENGDIVESAFDTFKAKEAVIEYATPESLNALLTEYVWDNSDSIGIDALWKMLTQHVYMPRFRNREVLTNAIKEGVLNGTFGYADDYDAEQEKYPGICFGQPVSTINPNGLIVKPDIAGLKPRLSLDSLTPILQENVWDARDSINIDALWGMLPEHVDANQLETETLIRCIEQGVPQGTFGYATGYVGGNSGSDYENLYFREILVSGAVSMDGVLVSPGKASAEKSKKELGSKRIVARKTVQGELSLDDIDDLRQEIIGPLGTDGGEVTVEITITAYKADGFSQNIERSVRENSVELDVDVNVYE